MLDAAFQEKVATLYASYNEVIRPLISEIEARQESFPTPLFNETSHAQIFSNKRMIIGEFHVAIKKQIIDT